MRLTRKFQEEQADERELERDEAAKQIQQLQEKLREREREKDRDQRNTSVEVIFFLFRKFFMVGTILLSF